MNTPKVNAARKSLETLKTPLDVNLWADAHPAEAEALERLQAEIDELEDAERWDGLS